MTFTTSKYAVTRFEEKKNNNKINPRNPSVVSDEIEPWREEEGVIFFKRAFGISSAFVERKEIRKNRIISYFDASRGSID